MDWSRKAGKRQGKADSGVFSVEVDGERGRARQWWKQAEPASDRDGEEDWFFVTGNALENRPKKGASCLVVGVRLGRDRLPFGIVL